MERQKVKQALFVETQRRGQGFGVKVEKPWNIRSMLTALDNDYEIVEVSDEQMNALWDVVDPHKAKLN